MIKEKLDWREKINNGTFHIRKVLFVHTVRRALQGPRSYKLKYLSDLSLYTLLVSPVFFLLQVIRVYDQMQVVTSFIPLSRRIEL